MGGVSRRLARIEEASQDRARAELYQAWAGLADREIATVLAPYAEWAKTSEPTEEARAVWEKTRAAMPEELIARAIGLTERMDLEEIDRRISDLVRSLGIFERGEGIRRHMLTSGGGDAR